ncbi:MAG: NAD(P)H-hydrate dehydratase [Pseudomonadota bacterium]|nr:NAD(P)H-hydrate dehydratase [Pseudomonadota bacterium]
MRPVLPVTRPFALLDATQTRALEQRVAATLEAHVLMRRAGHAVARLAMALAPHSQSFWVAAGPGNNGGDGLEAAIVLQAAGKEVTVSLLGEPERLPADAADALARARAAGVSIDAAPAPVRAPQFAIDALLGVGADRAPGGRLAEAIRALAGVAGPVLAVDLPSGLDARTGQPLGPDCVVASHTLAMLTLKPGLFTGAGRDHAGEVWLDCLGVDAGTDPAAAWLTGLEAAPARRHDSNKGSYGDVAVVGGAPGMTGAGLLAGRAALAAGAGRVYLALLDRGTGAPRIDVWHPELMFRDDWGQASPAVMNRTTVVCGCGGGDAVRGLLPRLLTHAGRLVLDADALNALATDTSLVALVRARRGRGRGTVLTPHPLEAARLLGTGTAEVQADRLGAGHALAQRFGCTVVLKGSGSVIAAPDHVPRINSTGNAALATAGTGDVLAGWLGGQWAQRHGPDEAALAFDIAALAVAQHGAGAEPMPSGSLRASDLIGRLRG